MLASGDVMHGWFKDDEFTGEGVKTTSGGYVFSGVWERGSLNGSGREHAQTPAHTRKGRGRTRCSDSQLRRFESRARWGGLTMPCTQQDGGGDANSAWETCGALKQSLLHRCINAGMESTAGVVYEGDFKDGAMEGEGVLTCDAEDDGANAREEGDFQVGHGFPGFKYKGQMVLGHASGAGSLEFAPLVYQGGFLDGRPHGQGTLSSSASLPGKKGGGTAIHRPVASLSFRECIIPVHSIRTCLRREAALQGNDAARQQWCFCLHRACPSTAAFAQPRPGRLLHSFW